MIRRASSKRLERVLPDTLFFEAAKEPLDHAVLLRRVGRDEFLLYSIVSTGLSKPTALGKEKAPSCFKGGAFIEQRNPISGMRDKSVTFHHMSTALIRGASYCVSLPTGTRREPRCIEWDLKHRFTSHAAKSSYDLVSSHRL